MSVAGKPSAPAGRCAGAGITLNVPELWNLPVAEVQCIFCGQSNLKACAMLSCEDLEFSLKGVSMAPSRSLMSRLGNKRCYNSGIKCPILPKLHMCDKGPGLNTSEGLCDVKLRSF